MIEITTHHPKRNHQARGRLPTTAIWHKTAYALPTENALANFAGRQTGPQISHFPSQLTVHCSFFSANIFNGKQTPERMP